MRVRAGLASCLLLAATALAQDESVFPGRSGDVYVDAVRRGGPTRQFEFDCPKGAVFSARIDGRNVANLIFTMSGQFQDEAYLQFVGGHGFVTRTCDASGRVSIVVATYLRVDAPYRLSVKWRSKSIFRAHGAPPGLVGELPFSADAGDSIACRVFDADPNPWALHAHEVDGPDGFVFHLGADRDRFVAPATGDYVLRYEASPQRVDRVRASIRVAPRRRRARTVRIGDGWPLDRLAVGTIGASGGQVVATEGLVAGASLDVPAYVLARDEVLVLGAAVPIVPRDETTLRAAGPAVRVYESLGDGRVRGLAAEIAEIAVPFDPARAGAAPRVFVRKVGYEIPQETSAFEVDGSVVRLRVADTPFTAQVFGTPDVAAPAALSAGAAALAADGASVAARGGTVAVGRPGDDLAAAGAGSVRVYDAADLSSPPTILVAPDAARGDGFGRSVALSSDGATLAVGTRLRESVYVFRRDGGAWSFDARIDAPAPGRRDGFGDAVAVDGDVLAVGAPHADSDWHTVDAGAVRVFERTVGGWSGPTTLEVPWGLAGSSLALDGGRLVVGSPRASIRHWSGYGETEWLGTGAVALFDRTDSGWRDRGLIVPFEPWEDSSDVEEFGRAVAIDGPHVLVGAPRTCIGGFVDGCGEAFLFDVGPTGSSTRVRLPGPRGYFIDFGASVALADGLAVVGATHNDPGDGPDAGSVSVFVREPGAWWPRRQVLRLATPVDGAAFGGSVALTGTLAVIGASGVAKDAGAALTVDLAPLK